MQCGSFSHESSNQLTQLFFMPFFPSPLPSAPLPVRAGFLLRSVCCLPPNCIGARLSLCTIVVT